MQRNFILTDIMKTGNHPMLEDFINLHSLKDQTFDYTGEYYTLHNYDLDKYDRRFAIIDTRTANKSVDNQEFRAELDKRYKLLHSQGFVFIKANPWESLENVNNTLQYPEIAIDHIKWNGGVSWCWFWMYKKHLNNKFKFTHDHFGSYWYKKHDFLYLNKQPRKHRVRLYNKLLKENVLSNSIYTNWPTRKLPPEYELPWAQDYPQYGMDQEIYEQPYIDTVCSIVSETNDNDTDVFMTEKIWKPIIAQQVFVVHGNHLYLQKLREIGFKTFGSYFDESYDLEHNRDKKIDKIVSLCKDLKTKNWQDIYRQTISLRQHNYNTFFNKEKLSAVVNKTLIGFLEFFDSSQVSS